MNELTSTILNFLAQAGIEVREGTVRDDSFLPGIEVENGSLVIEPSKLKYPGDLLHEAGHLAVAPGAVRKTMSGEVKTPGAPPSSVELMAMLWSYAACIHLGLAPSTVFHEHGYHGQSVALLMNFELGVFIGVHGLEATGMTLSPQDAERSGLQPFPVMQKWLSDL